MPFYQECSRLLTILSLPALANSAVLPQQLVSRQDLNDDHRWHGGFSPHHGYPGGNKHGVYTNGFGIDEYHGWSYAQPHSIPPGCKGANGSACISIPSSTPEGASPPIDPDFIGFAFEEASFVRYVQTRDGSPNQFSLNLIDAIMSRTGGKPIVRLGGTSADYARQIDSQSIPALPEDEVYLYQDVGGTSIGPSYWDLTHIIPKSVYIVQLPLASTNVSETVLWATTAAERVGIDRIQAFEPGNEPDLYPATNLTPPYYQGLLTYVYSRVEPHLSIP